MAPPLLALKDIRLTWGGEDLFSGIELSIAKGDRACLVGRNGSGKSTLLKIAAGQVEADDGEVFVQPGCHVAYLPQEPDFGGHERVLAYVAAGLLDIEADAVHRGEALLAELGVDPQADLANLSGGEKRRAAIARALVGEPDVLLLDEPTNHLDLPTIQWLEDQLRAFRGAFVVISHDRAFLETLTRVTLWLDRGEVKRVEKGYEHFEVWSAEVLERDAEERHKLDRLIAEETRWSHEGISARRKRNQGRLRRLKDLRQVRARWLDPVGRVKLEAETGNMSGKLVVEAEGIGKSYGERTLVEGFSTRLLRGDRVGVVGRNGAGKTTLLRLLTGDLEPDEGSVRMGTNLTPVYLDQQRAALNPDKTVWETLADVGGDMIDVRGTPRHVVSYMRDFLFDPRYARGPVGNLSGGERNRLLLAKALARPSNFLILDEPTNDLDMETLDLLQEMLADYEGTLILVSHDRDFLDRVVTSTIVLEGDGKAVEYAGGYSDYRAQKALVEEEKPAAPEAKPVKAAKVAQPRRKGPTKLGYKHQRRLQQLPDEMEALEHEIADLERTLHDPDLYSRDADAFHAASTRLEQAREELAAREEEWLEIELLRESLEGER